MVTVERFSKHLENIFNPFYQRFHTMKKRSWLHFLNKLYQMASLIKAIKIIEVKEIMRYSLNSRKAHRCHRVTGYVIKLLHEKFLITLALIFIVILRSDNCKCSRDCMHFSPSRMPRLAGLQSAVEHERRSVKRSCMVLILRCSIEERSRAQPPSSYN